MDFVSLWGFTNLESQILDPSVDGDDADEGDDERVTSYKLRLTPTS